MSKTFINREPQYKEVTVYDTHYQSMVCLADLVDAANKLEIPLSDVTVFVWSDGTEEEYETYIGARATCLETPEETKARIKESEKRATKHAAYEAKRKADKLVSKIQKREAEIKKLEDKIAKLKAD